MANFDFWISAEGHTRAANRPRRIAHRTHGETKGPMTRLAGPSDLGHLIKPFVLLYYISLPPETRLPSDLHAHSGIGSVSMVIDGSLHLRDSRDAPATLE